MRNRLLLSLLALAATLVGSLTVALADAGAHNRYRVGLGDQSFHLFNDPNFRTLGIRNVRIIIPWNFRTDSRADRPAFDQWLRNARANRHRVLVAFGAARGCYENGRYLNSRRCAAPTPRAFLREFRAFRRAYPFVREFQPWNEINHRSQPTFRRPALAARYFIVMKRACRSCTVVAADMLDSSNMMSYVQRVKRVIDRAARRQRFLRPRIWGLHNYSDVNRRRDSQTRLFVRRMPGQIWLTETGGLVQLLPNFRNNQRRAANRTRYMFQQADRLSRNRRGHAGRITRLYPYKFFAYTVAPGERNRQPRFDSGLVGPLLLDATFNPSSRSAQPRPAYRVFRTFVRRRAR